jgi:hypothetical protein
MELFWILKKKAQPVERNPKCNWLVRVKDYLELHCTEQKLQPQILIIANLRR